MNLTKTYFTILIYLSDIWHQILVVLPKFQKWKSVFFKSVLNLCSKNTYMLVEDMLNPPKYRMKYLYNSKGFSFMPEQVQCFYFFEAKFINVFKMC